MDSVERAGEDARQEGDGDYQLYPSDCGWGTKNGIPQCCVSGIGVVPHRSPTVDLQASGRNSANGLRIGDLLLFKHQTAHNIGGRVVGHCHRSLQHDGAVIVFVIGKVDRAAADFRTAIHDRFMHVMSEHAFAGLLRGERTLLTKARLSDLQVQASAEFVLEGCLSIPRCCLIECHPRGWCD